MEGTAAHAPAIGHLSASFPDSDFTLVDIGCAGGIDPIWRSVGPRLRALAIDGDITDIERLRRAETHPGVRYLAALASIPQDHPFARKKQGRGHWGRSPWNRLSTARSVELMKTAARRTAMDASEVHWSDAPQAPESIGIPDYLRQQGITSLDFLKIDVDGADFDILNSFDSELDPLNVLGVGIEINYFGSASDTDHTFHNVDRFMKARGFELFGLTVRRYSVAALPSRSLWRLPAATEFGRPLQGDALYVRDLAAPEYEAIAARMPIAKLGNLMSLFAAFDLPDCAADVAIRFRDRLRAACDVDRLLDLLAAQAQRTAVRPLSYAEYIRRFEASDPMFFTTEMEVVAPLASAPERVGDTAKQDGTDIQDQLRRAQDDLRRLHLELTEQHTIGRQRARALEDAGRQSIDAANRIAAMESSKFWKLRRAWFRIKRIVGLGGNE